MSDDERSDLPRKRGMLISDNIITDNGGAGISLPADMAGEVRRNYMARNAGGGLVVRDPVEDLLRAMRLQPNTPPETLARAIQGLRARPATDEHRAREVVESVGLMPWLMGKAPSLLDFIANLLAVANSPQGQAALGKLLG